MPHDPARVAETRGWLVRASSDVRAAEHELRATPPLLDDIVFHCQQAAEKSLKGFLTWHDRPFRKTHSIEELGEQIPSAMRFNVSAASDAVAAPSNSSSFLTHFSALLPSPLGEARAWATTPLSRS